MKKAIAPLRGRQKKKKKKKKKMRGLVAGSWRFAILSLQMFTTDLFWPPKLGFGRSASSFRSFFSVFLALFPF